MLRGALAAAVTPLRDGGERLDEGAFEPLVAFLAAGGLDGLLTMGTTGEGVPPSVDERRRAADRFAAAAAAWPAVDVAGAVSGLATAFPEVVAKLVHERSEAAHRAVTRLRRLLEPLPFHAAMKAVLAERGVPVRPDVRAPLRALADDERAAVLSALP